MNNLIIALSVIEVALIIRLSIYIFSYLLMTNKNKIFLYIYLFTATLFVNSISSITYYLFNIHESLDINIFLIQRMLFVVSYLILWLGVRDFNTRLRTL